MPQRGVLTLLRSSVHFFYSFLFLPLPNRIFPGLAPRC
jgi:hypothetical protein